MTLVNPSITPSARPLTMAPRIEPMPPITTTANTTMTSELPICGLTRITGADSTPASVALAALAGVGDGHQQRHIGAESLQQRSILGCGAQRSPQPGSLDDEPDREADRDRHQDHPGAIQRQDHEAEIEGASERGRHRIGLTRGTEVAMQAALDH